jgi:hypothetical protein
LINKNILQNHGKLESVLTKARIHVLHTKLFNPFFKCRAAGTHFLRQLAPRQEKRH